MAFFGLTDIKFNDIGRRGPLSALESSEKFTSSILRYPEDVASSPDKYHYMMFFVREQTNTQFSAETKRGFGQSFSKEDEVGIFDSFNAQVKGDGLVSSSAGSGLSGLLNSAIGSALSKGANILTGKGGTSGKIGSAINSFVDGPAKAQTEPKNNSAIQASVKEITDKSAFGFLNKTRLTKDAIALYMPDTVNFDSPASYSDLRPGEEKLGQFLAAAPELVQAYKDGGAVALGKTALKSGIAQLKGQELAAVAGNTGRLGLYAFTGRVTNPMIELIYGSPELRNFQFEFMFYPRSEKEAYEVQRIIDRFRFHQAPELDRYESGRQTGMLIPPSEFDIKFYYAGKQNPNIPPISSCVLTNVQVNFAPRGWSAYESLGENTPSLGGTGMPTAIQMSLQFKETTYITKEDFGDQSASKITQSQVAQSSVPGVVNSGGMMI